MCLIIHDPKVLTLSLTQAPSIQGGAITHEYHLIKAFAANAPAKVLETVQSMGTQSNVLIEEDQTVSINQS